MDSITLGNILYVSRALSNCKTHLDIPEKLRPSETLFISYIHRNPGCTQDQIVKYTGMDKTTVAHRMNKLEEQGLVTRRVSEKDGRKRLCQLTEKGESLYPPIHEHYMNFRQGVLGTFTEEELALLDSLTARIKENAARMIREAEKDDAGEE